MESLERSRAVIDLGKRLIAQLKLENDETAQWMAHALAERIHAAENSPPEIRVSAQNACAELVFQLWNRRYSFSPQLRPFRKLEPLLRTLDSLDVNNGPGFRFMPKPSEDIEVEEAVKQMLDTAVNLDHAARILVQYFLAEAAEQATGEVKSWIQSAVDAGADVTLELRISRFVDSGLDRSVEEARVAREALTNKLQKLEAFASLATAYAAELRAKHSLLADDAGATEPEDEQ